MGRCVGLRGSGTGTKLSWTTRMQPRSYAAILTQRADLTKPGRQGFHSSNNQAGPPLPQHPVRSAVSDTFLAETLSGWRSLWSAPLNLTDPDNPLAPVELSHWR